MMVSSYRNWLMCLSVRTTKKPRNVERETDFLLFVSVQKLTHISLLSICISIIISAFLPNVKNHQAFGISKSHDIILYRDIWPSYPPLSFKGSFLRKFPQIRFPFRSLSNEHTPNQPSFVVFLATTTRSRDSRGTARGRSPWSERQDGGELSQQIGQRPPQVGIVLLKLFQLVRVKAAVAVGVVLMNSTSRNCSKRI